MIRVKLMGGLGNQMFQYAMARTLAHRNDCPLLIDKSLCVESERSTESGLSLRPFELQVFGIQGQIANGESPHRILKIRKEHRCRRAAGLLLCKAANLACDSWRVCVYERRDVAFDRSLLNLPRNVVLEGYFPSYKYFQEIEDILRREYTFSVEADERNQRMIDMISSCNSISLHIRRGDYISDRRAKDRFGVCSLAYYRKAVEYLAGAVEEPQFFVFTNDPDYVRDNLKMHHPTVHVAHNTGTKSYEDMRLMSLCKHNIIANSSFSWWGAWINGSPGKIVVAPSPAFDKLTLDDSDFYPEPWTLFPKS